MISDLQQPAKEWLADHLQNFGAQLDAGEDPSFSITYQGIEVEIRLNKLPGVFEREIVKAKAHNDLHKPPQRSGGRI